jgi:hypothetical protein
VVVTSDPDDALAAVAARGDAVLIVSPGSEPGPEPGPLEAGRVAVLVGEVEDPGIWAAAEEMDRELFGRSTS